MAFTSWMICPKGFPSPLISIHAPRTGSDNCTSWGCYLQRNFNPRSPHGERRWQGQNRVLTLDISIHAPRTGSDDG